MAQKYFCPQCHTEIPLENINVSTDLALCVACGKTSAFSSMAQVDGVSLDALEERPKHVRIERGMRGGKGVIYRRLSPIVLFFIPFTAIWAGGSMWGIYGTQLVEGKLDLGQSLFGLPFLFGSLVLISLTLFFLLGQWKVTMSEGEGNVFVGVGAIGWNRYFYYNHTTRVSIVKTNIRVNNVPQDGIKVQTDDKELVFGTGIKKDSQKYIAAMIAQTVKEK